MAPPRTGSAWRGQRHALPSSDQLFTLGKQGRKTGLVLPETGRRDEHGMEPIDDFFSSPTSRDGQAEEGEDDDGDDDEKGEDQQDDGEADMDWTTASGPDPTAILHGQRSAMRLAGVTRSPAKATLYSSPPVRSAAARKTGLGSSGGGSSGALRRNPAIRQNPALRPPRSPIATRAPLSEHLSSSPAKPVRQVKRRLDFSKDTSTLSPNRPYLPPPKAHGRRGAQAYVEEEADEAEEAEEADEVDEADEADEAYEAYDEGAGGGQEEHHDASMLMADTDEDALVVFGNDNDSEPSPEAEPNLEPPKRKRGRPHRISDENDTVVASRHVQDEDKDMAEQQQRAKRQRRAADETDEAPVAKPRPRNQLTSKKATTQNEPGPKRTSSGVGAATATVAAVPRGPPLPRSHGLVIRRRGMGDGDGDDRIVRTRSGRSSFRPLAYWRNEHAEFDADVQYDRVDRTQARNRHFVLPTVREIVRVEEEDLPPLATKMGHGRHTNTNGEGAGGGGRRGKGERRRKRRGASVDYEGDAGDEADGGLDREAWETDPGKVTGEVIVWQPEHELDPPAPGQEVEMAPSEIALSSAAIQTHDVRGGTFRFVKTLSLPFFGTGMVDLPPGTEKRPKNARKMHMTFFVHYGQVAVTVNETAFRIAKGGMWSVPRGNYYSITNDTDIPARIFFAQGCEMLTSIEPDA